MAGGGHLFREPLLVKPRQAPADFARPLELLFARPAFQVKPGVSPTAQLIKFPFRRPHGRDVEWQIGLMLPQCIKFAHHDCGVDGVGDRRG